MRSSSVAILTSIAFLAACAPPTAQTSAEIEALGESWDEMLNAGDLDGLIDLYTEDARILAPNAEMGQGKDAVRADFQALVDAGLSAAVRTIEAMAAGDLGYRVGTYTLNAPDGSVVDRGKFVESWRKVGGGWKITNDMYNSDMPAGPTGSLVIGTHDVGDPAVWLAAWQADDRRREQFASHGAASVRIFQNPENPIQVGVLIDVADMEALKTFLDSEEGAAAKAEDTVDDKTLRMLVEVR